MKPLTVLPPAERNEAERNPRTRAPDNGREQCAYGKPGTYYAAMRIWAGPISCHLDRGEKHLRMATKYFGWPHRQCQPPRL